MLVQYIHLTGATVHILLTELMEVMVLIRLIARTPLIIVTVLMQVMRVIRLT